MPTPQQVKKYYARQRAEERARKKAEQAQRKKTRAIVNPKKPDWVGDDPADVKAWRLKGKPQSQKAMQAHRKTFGDSYMPKNHVPGSKRNRLLESSYAGVDPTTDSARGLVDELRQGQRDFNLDDKERSKFSGEGTNDRKRIADNNQQFAEEGLARDFMSNNELDSFIIDENGEKKYLNLGGFNPDKESQGKGWKWKFDGPVGEYNSYQEFEGPDFLGTGMSAKNVAGAIIGGALTAGVGSALGAGGGLLSGAGGKAAAGAAGNALSTAVSGGDLEDILISAGKGGLTSYVPGKVGDMAGFGPGVVTGAIEGATKEALQGAFEGEFDLGEIAKSGLMGGGIAAGSDYLQDANQTKNMDELKRELLAKGISPENVDAAASELYRSSDVGKLFGKNNTLSKIFGENKFTDGYVPTGPLSALMEGGSRLGQAVGIFDDPNPAKKDYLSDEQRKQIDAQRAELEQDYTEGRITGQDLNEAERAIYARWEAGDMTDAQLDDAMSELRMGAGPISGEDYREKLDVIKMQEDAFQDEGYRDSLRYDERFYTDWRDKRGDSEMVSIWEENPYATGSGTSSDTGDGASTGGGLGGEGLLSRAPSDSLLGTVEEAYNNQKPGSSSGGGDDSTMNDTNNTPIADAELDPDGELLSGPDGDNLFPGSGSGGGGSYESDIPSGGYNEDLGKFTGGEYVREGTGQDGGLNEELSLGGYEELQDGLAEDIDLAEGTLPDDATGDEKLDVVLGGGQEELPYSGGDSVLPQDPTDTRIPANDDELAAGGGGATLPTTSSGRRKQKAKRDADKFRLATILKVEGLPKDIATAAMVRLKALLAEEETSVTAGDATAVLDSEATRYIQKVNEEAKRPASQAPAVDPIAQAIKEAVA